MLKYQTEVNLNLLNKHVLQIQTMTCYAILHELPENSFSNVQNI